MRLLALSLLLASGSALAGEDWLVGTAASYHFKRNGQNEFNAGLGAELAWKGRWRAFGGFYDNSSNRLTVYGGATYEWWRHGALRAFTMAALATGYDARPIPIAGPGVAVEGRGFGVNVFFLPGAGGVIGLQVKVPWR